MEMNYDCCVVNVETNNLKKYGIKNFPGDTGSVIDENV